VASPPSGATPRPVLVRRVLEEGNLPHVFTPDDVLKIRSGLHRDQQFHPTVNGVLNTAPPLATCVEPNTTVSPLTDDLPAAGRLPDSVLLSANTLVATDLISQSLVSGVDLGESLPYLWPIQSGVGLESDVSSEGDMSNDERELFNLLDTDALGTADSQATSLRVNEVLSSVGTGIGGARLV
jgi:hypothetical protein